MHFVVTVDNVVELYDGGSEPLLRSEAFEEKGLAFQAIQLLKAGAAGAPVEDEAVLEQRQEELANPPAPPDEKTVADPVEERRAVEEANAEAAVAQAEREEAERHEAMKEEEKQAKAAKKDEKAAK